MDRVIDNITNPSISMIAIVKEEGVADLTPMKVRNNFAKALKLERMGDEKAALEMLDEAISYIFLN